MNTNKNGCNCRKNNSKSKTLLIVSTIAEKLAMLTI